MVNWHPNNNPNKVNQCILNSCTACTHEKHLNKKKEIIYIVHNLPNLMRKGTLKGPLMMIRMARMIKMRTSSTYSDDNPSIGPSGRSKVVSGRSSP